MEIKNICIQTAVLGSNGDVSEEHASPVFDVEGTWVEVNAEVNILAPELFF